MGKDMKEAEGILVYPKEEESADLTQCFVGRKEGDNMIAEPCLPETVEEERKKAEGLAQELILSTNESEDNIKEKVLQEEPAEEETPVEQPLIEAEAEKEPEFNFVEMPKPEPEEIKIEEKVPEILPLEKLPSAKELGLEEAEQEKVPSAKELGLEEAEKELAEEKLRKIDENEEKLQKIAETTFELEEKLKKIGEDKAPFEKRKKEIQEEIDNIKKKLDLILERKNRVDEIKKDLEAKEAIAQTPEEKRSVEKERWKVEDDRNTIEKEKDAKEDEIKSLKLQMRECDLNAEKIMGKEKEATQELEILKRDKDRIILGQNKLELVKRLQPLEAEIENIKREMFENTKLKDKSDKALNDIKMKEKAVEDEIKILERRQGETKDEVILRDIETRRRNIEETRRQLEKDRWDVEDKTGDLEEKRKLIKEKYQEVSAQARQIKEELAAIEEKIK